LAESFFGPRIRYMPFVGLVAIIVLSSPKTGLVIILCELAFLAILAYTYYVQIHQKQRNCWIRTVIKDHGIVENHYKNDFTWLYYLRNLVVLNFWVVKDQWSFISELNVRDEACIILFFCFIYVILVVQFQIIEFCNTIVTWKTWSKVQGAISAGSLYFLGWYAFDFKVTGFTQDPDPLINFPGVESYQKSRLGVSWKT
jgi:hypothetical protein